MNKPASRYEQYMYSYPHKTAYRTFESPVDIRDYLEEVMNQEVSLYFHIPFCRYKCGYCNLFSQAGCNTYKVDQYLQAMERQANQLSSLTQNLTFTSFAIGGGTPLYLSLKQLDKVFYLAGLFGVNPHQTFTSVETSPDYSGKSLLLHLHSKGVQRISIGIQSLIEQELKQLRRPTTLTVCLEALETIQSCEFKQFNIDLIYGIQGQTIESFIQSLEKALSFSPNELFLYPLYVRQGTGIREKTDDIHSVEMYRAAKNILNEKGFIQTSMRRFVKRTLPETGFTCGDEGMVSCGVGGRSYLGKLHTAAPFEIRPKQIEKQIENYIRTIDYTVVNHGIILAPEEKRRRFIIKNLMYFTGLNADDYWFRFKEVLDKAWFEEFISYGWIKQEENVLKLTEEGMEWSDYIGAQFISSKIRNLMTEYAL